MVTPTFSDNLSAIARLFICICIAVIRPSLTLAQLEQDTDFPIDYSDSTDIETVEIYGAGAANTQSRMVSLRAFTPPIGDMGKAPSGQSLGWAFGYYAPGITFRLKPSEVLSPYFLFDMLTKANNKCQLTKSNYMQEMQHILTDIGCLRKTDYPVAKNCMDRPNLAGYHNALKYRIIVNKVLGVRGELEALKPSTVLFAIRKKLDANIPVVGIMKADGAFRKLGPDAWEPNDDTFLFSHAVVIVGYDDFKQEIEVVSAWGKGWGNGGFGRIKYQNLTYFKQLYQVSKPTDLTIAKIDVKQKIKPKSDPIARPARTVKVAVVKTKKPIPLPAPARADLFGNIRFRRSVGESEEGKPVFEDLTFADKNGIYQSPTGKTWEPGAKFQLVVNGLSRQTYLYIFSVDPLGKAQIHWPKNPGLQNGAQTAYSSLISDSETAFVIPRPKMVEEGDQIVWKERAFRKTDEGTDYLVILHSSEPLENQELLSIVGSLEGKYSAVQFSARLNAALGTSRIKTHDLVHASTQIQYAVKSGTGYVFPVVLKID